MKTVKQDYQITAVKTTKNTIDIGSNLNLYFIQSISSFQVLQELYWDLIDSPDKAQNIIDLVLYNVVNRQIKVPKVVFVEKYLAVDGQ